MSKKTKQHVINEQSMIIQNLRAEADINREELSSATQSLKDHQKELGVLRGEFESAKATIDNCALHLETGIKMLYPEILDQSKWYDPPSFERKVLKAVGEDNEIPPKPIERLLFLLSERLCHRDRQLKPSDFSNDRMMMDDLRR